MSWSIPRGWRTHNPCTKIRMLRIGEGYAPWTGGEIETFRAHARPDLWRAAAVALYSGQRQGDVLGMLWSDIQDGLLFVTQKLRDRELVFHGLRKSAVVFLLEAGCSDAEVSAITGQSRGMIAHYARQVNQKRLAATAVLKWQAADSPGRNKNEFDPGL